ncbi:MAG: NFACT family protein [Candidatus Diapherotrites archaeon]|nr:NFACT family protein [Candidatus Diapherotrites archaeon]
MELTNIALAYQVNFLNEELKLGFINKLQRLDNGFIKIKVHTKKGSKDLIIANNAAFITQYSFPASQNSSGFEGYAKKILFNKRINEITQPEYERTIKIEFEDFNLICEFFPESNVILTDKQNIVQAFKKQFKSEKRKMKKGLMFPEREKTKINPLNVSAEEIKKIIESTNPEKALIDEINAVPLIIKEALNSVQKNKAGKQELNAKKLAEKIIELHEINEKKLSPKLIEGKVYPFELKTIKKEQKEIESINSALDELYRNELEGNPKLETEKKEKQKSLNKIEASIKQQMQAKDKFLEEIKKNQEKAEMIYQNYTEIEEIINAINSAVKKGLREKEIMQTFKEAGEKGNKTASMIKSIDLKKKEVEIEI